MKCKRGIFIDRPRESRLADISYYRPVFKCRWVPNCGNTFVNVWYLVRIPDRLYVQLTVVDEKAKNAVFRKDWGNSWGPFRLASPELSVGCFRFMSCFSSFLFLCQAHCGAEWAGRVSLFYSLVWCCTALIEPKCLFQCSQICVSMSRLVLPKFHQILSQHCADTRAGRGAKGAHWKLHIWYDRN